MDLTKQLAPIRMEIDAAIAHVLNQSQFILGEEVTRFEEEFAAFCGVRECVGVDSGISALELVLRAIGVGPGDEVITVSHTFIATVSAISFTGATPVLVDVCPDTFLMDPSTIEAAITPRTRAIVPVHLYGQTVDMDPLLEIAARYQLFVLEDACQAHGAQYKGRRAGGLGHAAAFSFHPVKNLGAAGDAGAVTTNDPALAERVRMLRNYGQKVRYYHQELAYNRRLDNLQAAILRVKLRMLDEWNEERRRLAKLYAERLEPLPLLLPRVAPRNEAVWHLYVIQVAERDMLRERLEREGIGTGLHYPVPVHLQQAYPEYRSMKFPVSEWVADHCLSLPLFIGLTNVQLERIATTLEKALQGVAAPVKPVVPVLMKTP